MPKFVAYHVCVKCEKELTDNERCYSDGVCPHCGHVSQGTICDTEKKSRKKK